MKLSSATCSKQVSHPCEITAALAAACYYIQLAAACYYIKLAAACCYIQLAAAST